MGWVLLRRVLVIALLLASARSNASFVKLALTNAEMDTFVSGVATDWTSFSSGSVPPTISYFADSDNFRTSPYAQGIAGIDTVQPAGNDFCVGVKRTVATTAGKVYLFVGFQDLYDPTYAPPPGRRYAHFFGIGPNGSETPPAPFSMGAINWMGLGQWFYNDQPGNSTQVGGLHRCMAACPAASNQMSIWTGVHAYGDGPVAANPTNFDADSHSVFEFQNNAQASLQNATFETVDNLTPELGSSDVHRITVPAYWVPVGGGIGQNESYYTDYHAAKTGTNGLRIYNKRGCLTRGVVQRVSVPADSYQVTFTCWTRANTLAGAIARAGIDPQGGTDINSADISWATYDRTDEAWQQLSTWSRCTPGTNITVFIALTNTGTSTSYYGDFDDAETTFGGDPTPPEDFQVVAPTPATLLHFLTAAITPTPYDPETGIAAVDYAVETTPGGQEIRPFTPCTDWTQVAASELNLSLGSTYYISVRAANGAGLTRTVTSNPILCQPGPYTYSWSGPQHLSQTAYSADSPRIAVGSSETLLAVWRESNDVTWNGTASKIVMREAVGGRWQSPVTVSAANAWWPDVSAIEGGVAVSYTVPGDSMSNELRLATRPDAGSFTSQPAATQVSAFPKLAYLGASGFAVGCNRNPLGNPAQGEPSLVIKGASWNVERLPGNAYSDTGMRVSVAAVGAVTHCLYAQFDQGQPTLFYCRRDAGGTYSPARLVARGAADGDIAVGADGAVHVVYVSGGGIWYTSSSDGVSFAAAEYLDSGTFAQVCVEPSGRIHVITFATAGSLNENGVALTEPTHLFRDGGDWSMPQTICPASCTSGIWAEQPGTLALDSSGALHFVWSNNPHDRGWQDGQFEGYYWIDYYSTGMLPSESNSILHAKLWGDDAPAAELGLPASKIVNLMSKQVIVSGTFEFAAQIGESTVYKSVPCFYTEEDDRLSAIRVIAGDAQDIPQPPTVGPGDLVNVSGALSTLGGERSIGLLTPDGLAQEVAYSGAGTAENPIRPFCMQVRALGGSAFGPTPGITGGIGLNNLGLLVSIAGGVVSVATDNRGLKVLYIDDGSGVPCGPSFGFKVCAPESSAQTGDFVVVTGASSVEQYDPTPGQPGDETYVRVIFPRDPSAVRIVPH